MLQDTVNEKHCSYKPSHNSTNNQSGERVHPNTNSLGNTYSLKMVAKCRLQIHKVLVMFAILG